MSNNKNQATVLEANDPVSNMSQAALAEEWWKTVYSIPKAEHFSQFDDATDPRGRRGSVEKALEAQFEDSVLFIGGAFGEINNRIGTDGVLRIQRTVILPNNGSATVFLPMLNNALDNVVNSLDDPKNMTGNMTVEELQALNLWLLSSTNDGGAVSHLFASVDGHVVNDPLGYRQASEDWFSYTAPYPIENSLLSSIGFTDESYLYNAGDTPIQLKDLAQENQVTIDPVVADGYWLAIDITGGAHTLNFAGQFTLPDFFFGLDITYNILNPIYGGNGKDNLNGTKENDYISGGNGKDSLFGNEGDDLLVGGNGNDVIDGGKGNDELWGDGGKDTFIFKRGYGQDMIFDFSRGEIVEIPGLPVSGICVTNVDDLPSRMDAVQVDFGGGDILTFVGLQIRDLNIQRGSITFAC